MSILDEPNWKGVAETFWHACSDGDGDLLEHMMDKYAGWFAPEDEEEE